MYLGERLRILRKESNLNQAEFATKYSVSDSAYWSYESNSRKPSYELLMQIADDYNVTLDWLLGRSDKRHDETCVDLTEGLNEKQIEAVEEYVTFIKVKDSLKKTSSISKAR